MPAPRIGAAALAKGFQDERYRRLVDRLIERRKELGLRQEDVAKRLGTHQQFVSRFETGERRLDAVELVDIASTLGLNAADLLRDVPHRS